MINGTQQKLGYREVIFNINSKGFYAPLPGDNYEALPIQSGDGGGVSTFGTGDINLETPTVTGLAALPDTSGLQTQQDFNVWAVAALEALAAEAVGDGDGDGNVGINDVLTNDNYADAGQVLHFKVSENASIPNYDDPSVNPIRIEPGVGSNHRALWSTWTLSESADHMLHTDVSAAGIATYELGADLEPLSTMRLHPVGGLYLYGRPTDGPSWGGGMDKYSFDYNSVFRVTAQGDGRLDGKLRLEELEIGPFGGNDNVHIFENGDMTTTGSVLAEDGVILKSGNGTQYKLVVADDGTLSTTAV